MGMVGDTNRKGEHIYKYERSEDIKSMKSR